MQQDFAVGLSDTAQLITAAVMAFLLFGFYRQYRKDYLSHWTMSWAALAVSQFAALTGQQVALHTNFAAHHPWRLLPLLIASVAGYLHIGWTMFGIYELLRRRPVRLREAKVALWSLAGFGLMTAATSVWTSAATPARLQIQTGTFAVAQTLAFGVAGLALWRGRRRGQRVGMAVLSVACLAHGLVQLQVFAGERGFTSTALQTVPLHLGYIRLLVLSLIGLGMIACLLEDEREAAELAVDEIEHLAYHDALTGLPNRPLFMDRLIIALAQATRDNQKLAVLFLDLDRFKEINDSLGHTVGDTLLKAVAERIRRCVRDGDTVARLGGDEFTLLIPKLNNIEDAAKIANKIIDTLKVPFLVQAQEIFVTTSIGVSLYPSDGLDPETLVRNADAAMYRAKDQGRDNYQLYAPAMNAQAVERLYLESTLRKAITQKDLIVYYQPLFDATTEAVVGAEALLRWRHRERGLLSPGAFITLAEVSGLIVPIGDWVLREACGQVREWQKSLGLDITVAVNLSARQFQQPDLVEQIRSAIVDSGIEPSSLDVEITESSAMQNADVTIYTLQELKALGVRISMDDFGTGYSSLNYLKRFPIDTLKLDQTFVRDIDSDPRNAAIVNAMIQMAHSLDLKVVAEGVERQAQLDFLRRQGCDVIQGYYYAKPMPPEEFAEFIVERRRSSQVGSPQSSVLNPQKVARSTRSKTED